MWAQARGGPSPPFGTGRRGRVSARLASVVWETVTPVAVQRMAGAKSDGRARDVSRLFRVHGAGWGTRLAALLPV